jgi:hypothetical protein
MTDRLCRINDAADVVPGRICGARLPCSEHGETVPSDPRWISKRASRLRPLGTISLAPETWERLDQIAQRSGSTRSATIERLVRTAKLPKQVRT